MPYVVSLSQFEGPLDLLLHLISRAKVNIQDVFVSEITEQYLSSIEDLSGLDMDAASEFLQMAATLMEIKSRALLPKAAQPEGDEEDPEKLLLYRLEEYRKIKEASLSLRKNEEEALCMVARLPMEMVDKTRVELSHMSLAALEQAFLRVLSRAKAAGEALPLPERIQREEFTIGDMMLRILNRALLYKRVPFTELFPLDATRAEVVTTFIAMLELMRSGRILVRQDEDFQEIYIQMAKMGEEGAHGDTE